MPPMKSALNNVLTATGELSTLESMTVLLSALLTRMAESPEPDAVRRLAVRYLMERTP